MPQLGPYVFYGVLHGDDRDGPIIGGQQVIYIATIDEKRRVVNFAGRGIANPEKYEHLQDHPEFWKDVRQRECVVNCDFIWHRQGEHLVGVLEGLLPKGLKGGPGTCTYISPNNDTEMRWDAVWVLGPEELWIYDNGYIGTHMCQGRYDKVHSENYRARPYDCAIKRSGKVENVELQDRGYGYRLQSSGDLSVQLLRMKYPGEIGMRDQIHRPNFHSEAKTVRPIAEVTAPQLAESIKLSQAGMWISSRRKPIFAPMKDAP